MSGGISESSTVQISSRFASSPIFASELSVSAVLAASSLANATDFPFPDGRNPSNIYNQSPGVRGASSLGSSAYFAVSAIIDVTFGLPLSSSVVITSDFSMSSKFLISSDMRHSFLDGFSSVPNSPPFQGSAETGDTRHFSVSDSDRRSSIFNESAYIGASQSILMSEFLLSGGRFRSAFFGSAVQGLSPRFELSSFLSLTSTFPGSSPFAGSPWFLLSSNLGLSFTLDNISLFELSTTFSQSNDRRPTIAFFDSAVASWSSEIALSPKVLISSKLEYSSLIPLSSNFSFSSHFDVSSTIRLSVVYSHSSDFSESADVRVSAIDDSGDFKASADCRQSVAFSGSMNLRLTSNASPSARFPGSSGFNCSALNAVSEDLSFSANAALASGFCSSASLTKSAGPSPTQTIVRSDDFSVSAALCISGGSFQSFVIPKKLEVLGEYCFPVD
jgi:hypothetical protein